MVPQALSMRLLHAIHRWMVISNAPTVLFQRITPQARSKYSLLQGIIKRGKSGIRLEQLGDAEHCNSLWGHTHQKCQLKKAEGEENTNVFQESLEREAMVIFQGVANRLCNCYGKKKKKNKKKEKKHITGETKLFIVVFLWKPRLMNVLIISLRALGKYQSYPSPLERQTGEVTSKDLVLSYSFVSNQLQAKLE